ncbi:MAG TPA: GDP-mannose 4,6-dehydratase [Candidatus Andersenbacteria bacterium]|nr:GDP-mannose 4,6-dehydratase [Candidatus Andersenbacteria bacterium]
MPQTVVITGGNGFVGRHLVTELRAAEPTTRVIVWDRSIDDLLPGTVGVAVDMMEPASYEEHLREAQPSWVVHLAAVASVAAAKADPALTSRLNVGGTRALLSLVQRVSRVTRVLAVSTADIYGQGSSTPLPELPLAEAWPSNAYAQSKWEMERVIERDFNDFVIRVRPFPHIGPGQKLGYVTADFASQIAAAEAGQQAPIIRVGNLEAQRDFTDVRDVVRAYRLLLQFGQAGDVYHVASGRAVSVQQVLDRLLALSARTIVVEQDPARMRAADTPILVGDARKLRQVTAWQPAIALEDSLADILTWWRTQ